MAFMSLLIKHVFTVQDNIFGIENVQSTPSPVRNHLNRRIVADINLKMIRYSELLTQDTKYYC